MSRSRRIDDLRVRAAAARLTEAGQRSEQVCDGKAQYHTKARAKEIAAQMTNRYCEKSYPYECPACGRWHLTTMRPEEFRARQRGAEGVQADPEKDLNLALPRGRRPL